MLVLPDDDPCLRDTGDRFGTPLPQRSNAGPRVPRRPYTAVRTVDELERIHRARVRSRLRVFQRSESRDYYAFAQMQTKPAIIRDTTKRRKDLGIIEAITDAKNTQWRAELAAGKPPEEINIHINKRARLPHENPRKWRKSLKPVFFWG